MTNRIIVHKSVRLAYIAAVRWILRDFSKFCRRSILSGFWIFFLQGLFTHQNQVQANLTKPASSHLKTCQMLACQASLMLHSHQRIWACSRKFNYLLQAASWILKMGNCTVSFNYKTMDRRNYLILGLPSTNSQVLCISKPNMMAIGSATAVQWGNLWMKWSFSAQILSVAITHQIANRLWKNCTMQNFRYLYKGLVWANSVIWGVTPSQAGLTGRQTVLKIFL